MAKRKKSPDEMTVEELRTEAAAQGIEGRSGMNRDELITALSAVEAPGGTDDAAHEPHGAAEPLPPSPSDTAGEKTDNVPPAKRVPPGRPGAAHDAAGDELARLRAANTALAAVVRNLGGNPDAVVRTATAHLEPAAQARAAKGPQKRATVTPKGGESVEVEYPADVGDDQRDAAAVTAYKAHAGIWSLPEQPGVAHHD